MDNIASLSVSLSLLVVEVHCTDNLNHRGRSRSSRIMKRGT